MYILDVVVRMHCRLISLLAFGRCGTGCCVNTVLPYSALRRANVNATMELLNLAAQVRCCVLPKRIIRGEVNAFLSLLAIGRPRYCAAFFLQAKSMAGVVPSNAAVEHVSADDTTATSFLRGRAASCAFV